MNDIYIERELGTLWGVGGNRSRACLVSWKGVLRYAGAQCYLRSDNYITVYECICVYMRVYECI